MNENIENSMIAGGESEATLLAKVREAVKQVEMDFQAKQPATEELLRESQAKEQGILDLLDNRVRQLVSENAELGQQVQGLKQQLNTTEKEKAEAEKKAEAALNDVVDAEDRIRKLLVEKTETEKRVETILLEKAEIEKRVDAANKEKEDAKKRIKAAFDERAEMEKKLAEVSSSTETLNKEIAGLKEELTRTAATAEAAVRERTQYQEKLDQLQENWEKYIADK